MSVTLWTFIFEWYLTLVSGWFQNYVGFYHYLPRKCLASGVQESRATKFYAVAPNILTELIHFFPYIQKCVSFDMHRADNRGAHRSLQNCYSSVWNLLRFALFWLIEF